MVWVCIGMYGYVLVCIGMSGCTVSWFAMVCRTVPWFALVCTTQCRAVPRIEYRRVVIGVMVWVYMGMFWYVWMYSV